MIDVAKTTTIAMTIITKSVSTTTT
jgi:hypothetical protein